MPDREDFRGRTKLMVSFTRGNGIGFVTSQDVVVGQLVVPVAITLCKLCKSFNSGKLAYIEIIPSFA